MRFFRARLPPGAILLPDPFREIVEIYPSLHFLIQFFLCRFLRFHQFFQLNGIRRVRRHLPFQRLQPFLQSRDFIVNIFKLSLFFVCKFQFCRLVFLPWLCRRLFLRMLSVRFTVFRPFPVRKYFLLRVRNFLSFLCAQIIRIPALILNGMSFSVQLENAVRHIIQEIAVVGYRNYNS